MEHLVIWEQEYDLSTVLAVITPDKIGEYIKHWGDEFLKRSEYYKSILEVRISSRIDDICVNYVVEYDDGHQGIQGFSYKRLNLNEF